MTLLSSDLPQLGLVEVDGKLVRRNSDEHVAACKRVRQIRTVKAFIAAPIVSEANSRDHWAPAQKRAKVQRLALARAIGEMLATAPAGVPKRVTFVLLSAQEQDDDNLRRSLKVHRDFIATRLEFNDREKVWRYEQRKPFDYESRGVWVKIEW